MIIVDIKKFVTSTDYKKCLEFINDDIIKNVSKIVLDKNPGTRVASFGLKPTLSEYMEKFEVPFFDIPMSVGVIRNNKFYVDIDAYTYAMNCQFKSIFLRKFWSNDLKDNFSNFIWDNYKKGQQNNEFDNFEKIARNIFDKSETVYDFTKNFIYDNKYEFFSRDDIINTFEELIKNKILRNAQREGENYKMDDEFLEAVDSYSSSRPEMVNAIFYAKFYDKFSKCESKFNYLPSPKFTSKTDCIKNVKGQFMYMNHPKGEVFNLQLLLFY